jgi:hypothetical protein
MVAGARRSGRWSLRDAVPSSMKTAKASRERPLLDPAEDRIHIGAAHGPGDRERCRSLRVMRALALSPADANAIGAPPTARRSVGGPRVGMSPDHGPVMADAPGPIGAGRAGGGVGLWRLYDKQAEDQ